MGVSLQTIYRWEWGVSRVNPRKAQALALVLGVAVSDLTRRK